MFSGGIDASTLVSYKYLYEDRGGCDVAAGVLVHDFDVRL